MVALGGLLMSALHILGGLSSVVLGEQEFFTIFMASAVGIGAVSGAILLLTNKPSRRSRPLDGLAVALLFWLLAPLALMAPFFPLVSKGEAVLLSALYEAVSNLTTTGHSLADPSLTLPGSILIWRAILHMLGAIAFITMALSVFAALNLGGPGIHRTRFFTIPEDNFFDACTRGLRAVSIFIFAGVASVGFLLLIGGVAPRDALSVSVSVLTTGLVNPELSIQPVPSLTPILGTVIILGLCAGTLGLIFIDTLARGNIRNALFDAETISFTGLFIIAALFAVMAGLPLLNAAGWSLSSISTSGIQLADPDRLSRLPLVLTLFPVLIGGAALSTAGGIKLSRMILLVRRVGGEFNQLGYRKSVNRFNFRGIAQTGESLIGVWVYLVGYIMACVAGILVLSTLDQSFDSAILITIGSLANAGHLLQGEMTGSSPLVILSTLTGMILGRLEVIALLPALNPHFWRS